MLQILFRRFAPRVSTSLKRYESEGLGVRKNTVGRVTQNDVFARIIRRLAHIPRTVTGERLFTSAGAGGAGEDKTLAKQTGPPEMPLDLIKFLNDMGPLQRTVDKSRTSPKVYDVLVNDERAVEDQAKQANSRVRRRTPILTDQSQLLAELSAERQDGDASLQVENDGLTTTRTTNFSTSERAESTPAFHLTREDLFRCLRNIHGSHGTPEWTEALHHESHSVVSSFLGRAISPSLGSGDESDDVSEKVLLAQNSLRFIDVPVLMKDTDDSSVGVWSHKVESLKFSGLRVLPEDKLRFTFLQERKTPVVS